jgi:hypothetical protein
MRLVDNWWHVAKHAWSVRLTLLTAALGGLEAALPVFSDSIPHGPFLGLTIAASLASAVARLIEQPRMRDGQQ